MPVRKSKSAGRKAKHKKSSTGLLALVVAVVFVVVVIGGAGVYLAYSGLAGRGSPTATSTTTGPPEDPANAAASTTPRPAAVLPEVVAIHVPLAGPGALPLTAEIHTGATNQFQVQLPEGWVAINARTSWDVLRPPESDEKDQQAALSFRHAPLAQPMSMDEYVAHLKKAFQWGVSDERPALIGETPASRLIIDSEFSEKRFKKLVYVVGPINGQYHFLSCLSAPDRYEKLLPTFEAIIASYKPAGKQG